MSYQIGLDTGGTFTDAVLVDDQRCVLATAKALTRHEDLLIGLGEALDQVIGAHANEVDLVSVSTTLATNALVEGRGRPVGLILIGLDEARLGRARLADALGGDPVAFIAGGHTASGEEVASLDGRALKTFVAKHEATVEAWAVSALFATRNAAHENAAAAIVRSCSSHPVSLGHQLSAGLDAPRRALTALLNARLIPLIGDLLVAARQLLDTRAIAAPLMVVKGDGSLVAADVAAASPVETILSGPAASLVGARFLCGDDRDLMVADTGGTTTDIARLENGVPRLARTGATVGGWQTMVRAIDMRTVALGGDGELSLDPTDSSRFRLGRRRVVPLSLLAISHPAVLGVLRMQLADRRITSHDARFALVHRPATSAARSRLGRTDADLLAQIEAGPIDLLTLFAERSREQALERLTRSGLVILSGLTPSDICHLDGSQTTWNREASQVGAELLMRQATGGGGRAFDSIDAFVAAARQHVSEQLALALVDAVMADGADVAGLSADQRDLLWRGFSPQSSSILQVHARLAIPLAGLGGPAAAFHGEAARLLDTEALLPTHGRVANALGAVVGSVRQEVSITLVADGGTSVRVLLPGGPERCPTLEAGIAIAGDTARRLARDRAERAGVGHVTLDERHEFDRVERDGMNVLLECRVLVTATGRPTGR